MTRIIAQEKARQGRWGRHGLRILIAAMLLSFVAWGGAEIYGRMIDTTVTAEPAPPPPPSR